MERSVRLGKRSGKQAGEGGSVVWKESVFVFVKVGFYGVEGSSVPLLCNLIGDSKLVSPICRWLLPKIIWSWSLHLAGRPARSPEIFTADNRKRVNRRHSQERERGSAVFVCVGVFARTCVCVYMRVFV